MNTPEPAVTIELFPDADPCCRCRVTIGDLHACGPTPADALETINRARTAA